MSVTERGPLQRDNRPPPAMVARTSVSSSSSPRIASWRCRGVMRFTRKSFDAFPVANQPNVSQRRSRRPDVCHAKGSCGNAHLRAPKPPL